MFRVWFFIDESTEQIIDVEAEDIFNLVCLLETKYLYRKQFLSVFKIEKL